MRTLGFALVVLSLVFSTGGVAVVGRADTNEQSRMPGAADAPQTVAPAQSAAPAAKKLPDQCGPTTAFKAARSPKLYRDAKARKAMLPKDAVPLNTGGYNYDAQELALPSQPAKPAPAAPAAPAKP